MMPQLPDFVRKNINRDLQPPLPTVNLLNQIPMSSDAMQPMAVDEREISNIHHVRLPGFETLKDARYPLIESHNLAPIIHYNEEDPSILH